MIGDLIQARGGRWIVVAPTHCLNGHRLGPNRVLVGHTACKGHGGGHLTWTCRTCNGTLYGPDLGAHCTILDGPAAVRITYKPGPETPFEIPPVPTL